MEKQKSKFNRILLIISISIAIMFASFVFIISYYYHRYDLDVEKLTSVNNGIKVYSANETSTGLYNTNRSVVELDSLPNYVIDAFVNVEDKRFYSHSGYDLTRIIKAMFVNLTTQSKSQGASTITQQLIKNALLTNEKTYSRKIQEIVLSVKLEKEFSKEEILEMYLNTIYFGSNAYGIENASQIYFNKSSSDLTLNEACCLAGIIKSPKNYSPKTNYDNCIKRRNLVAKVMLEQDSISENEYKTIIDSEIKVINNFHYDNSYEEAAILEACDLLNKSERSLINEGISIITYKDTSIQENVTKINNEIINSSKTTYNTPLDSISIVVDNHGKVKSYYVNSNYNTHLMKRQPASLLKPFAVYLPCIEHNILSPATTIIDEPINFAGFAPNNADKKFHGAVSTREALAHSYNIPAVKALDYVGLNNAKETLEKLNIPLNNSDLNLSLALGATKEGISLNALAEAYLTIANMGTRRNITFIDKILDKEGNVIYSNQNFEEEVLNPADCYLLTDMLKDTTKYGTAKRLNELDIDVASKTGTASNFNGNTDLYNVAYTSEHVLLTWVSNLKDNLLPSQMFSSVEPTQINKEILACLYKTNKPKDFICPSNVSKMPYDISKLEETNTLYTPNHDIERYIAYDYFKQDNPPKLPIVENNITLSATIEINGANLTFKPNTLNNYNLIKKINTQTKTIAQVKDTYNLTEIIDNDIYSHEEISYYVTDFNNNIVSNIVLIRPKDYLINILNSEILSGKKKWLV